MTAKHELLDLVLQGGRVIDPAQNIDQVLDVGVKDGRLAALEKNIMPARARQVKNVKGKLVLPGLIDVHAHIYEHVTRPFGINADLAGVRSGATVLVDQGTASPFTFPRLPQLRLRSRHHPRLCLHFSICRRWPVCQHETEISGAG